MNIYKELNINTEKPVIVSIKKTDKAQIMAIGLGKGAVMKKHKTAVPATLIVIKGSINFNINNEDHDFCTGDIYEIPVDVEHEVTGTEDENVFVLTKEL